MGLEKLLYLRGVGADFTDCFGQYIRIPEADRQGILTCMLQDTNEPHNEAELSAVNRLTQSAIAAQVYQLDAQHWTQVLPAFHWCYVDEPWVCLYLPQSYRGDLLLTFKCEQGEVIVFNVPFSGLKPIGDYRIEESELARHGDSPFADECQFIQYRLDLLAHEFDCCDVSEQDKLSDVSCLGLGYHKLSVSLGDTTSTLGDCTSGIHHAELTARKANEFYGHFMLAPRTAYQGVMNSVAQRKRHKPWGVSVQLYSVRSDNQWGIGDFGDLEQLITLVAEYGADFIQLNPLHALDIAVPEQPSPYSPCDRRRLNPLYIHLSSEIGRAHV